MFRGIRKGKSLNRLESCRNEPLASASAALRRDKYATGSVGYALAAVSMLVLMAGCHLAKSGAEGSPRPPSQRIEMQKMVVGQSVQGRPIQCDMYGTGGETILMLAGIHGTERAGTPLLRKLGEHLHDHPELLEHRRVLIVPEANPDGCTLKTRRNVHGVDLNRNFPAKNFSDKQDHGRKALSEPESRALHDLVREYEPDRIITLHQPLNCVDYDGPEEAKTLAERMAARSDLKVNRVGARDGSLGSWAGETIGIPIVTVEFGDDAADLDGAEMWERYGKMLLAAIEFSGGKERAEVSRTMLP